jgi:ribosomal protein L11 methyltransferase
VSAVPDPDFIELRFRASSDDELVQATLASFEPLGFLEEAGGWSCYFASEAWTRIGADLRRALAARHPDAGFELLGIEKRNWNEEWERTIRPIAASERFLIAPSWHPVDDAGGRMVLVIDPKMSFGTGYHATTRLMLRLLEAAPCEGARVLDVGTGTGVLAIAAVALGAAFALGVDIDEWSRANAEENALRNGAAARTRFLHGGIELAQGSWDLELSNITKGDNLALLPRLLASLRPQGRLLLSGFTRADLPELRGACAAHGAAVTAELGEDEWAACEVVPRSRHS